MRAQCSTDTEGKQQDMHGETLTRPVQSHFSQPDIIKDFHQFLNDKEMNIK